MQSPQSPGDGDIATRIEAFLSTFRTQPGGMQMQGPEIEAMELLLIAMAELLRRLEP